MNTINLEFLKEILIRLSSKSPKFFKIISTILLVTTIIAMIPSALVYFEIVTSPKWNSIIFKLVSLSSLISSIITKLPIIEVKPVGITQELVYLPFSKIYAAK